MNPLQARSKIRIIRIDDLRPQFPVPIQLHQIIPLPHKRNGNTHGMPILLPHNLPIARMHRPDRSQRHIRIARHDRNHTVNYNKPEKRGHGMDKTLLEIALLGRRMPPFVAVLTAQVVQHVGDAVDDAGDGFAGFRAGDGGDGDVGFVLEFAVFEGPFVVGFEEAVEGPFDLGAADDIVSDVETAFAEVGEGVDGWWWSQSLAEGLFVYSVAGCSLTIATTAVIVRDEGFAFVVCKEPCWEVTEFKLPVTREQRFLAAATDPLKKPLFLISPGCQAGIVVVEGIMVAMVLRCLVFLVKSLMVLSFCDESHILYLLCIFAIVDESVALQIFDFQCFLANEEIGKIIQTPEAAASLLALFTRFDDLGPFDTMQHSRFRYCFAIDFPCCTMCRDLGSRTI